MPTVAAVVDDLLFLSRIREAARAAGADVVTTRTPDALVAAARAGARLVLVDADGQRLPWARRGPWRCAPTRPSPPCPSSPS